MAGNAAAGLREAVLRVVPCHYRDGVIVCECGARVLVALLEGGTEGGVLHSCAVDDDHDRVGVASYCLHRLNGLFHQLWLGVGFCRDCFVVVIVAQPEEPRWICTIALLEGLTQQVVAGFVLTVFLPMGGVAGGCGGLGRLSFVSVRRVRVARVGTSNGFVVQP